MSDIILSNGTTIRDDAYDDMKAHAVEQIIAMPGNGQAWWDALDDETQDALIELQFEANRWPTKYMDAGEVTVSEAARIIQWLKER